MVDASDIKRGAASQPSAVTLYRRYQVFEAIVSTNETIPLEIGTLADVAVFRSDTGAEVTATVATTIVTVTQGALVDVHCVGLAFGTV